MTIFFVTEGAEELGRLKGAHIEEREEYRLKTMAGHLVRMDCAGVRKGVSNHERDRQRDGEDLGDWGEGIGGSRGWLMRAL